MLRVYPGAATAEPPRLSAAAAHSNETNSGIATTDIALDSTIETDRSVRFRSGFSPWALRFPPTSPRLVLHVQHGCLKDELEPDQDRESTDHDVRVPVRTASLYEWIQWYRLQTTPNANAGMPAVRNTETALKYLMK
jgi:hypothetical protein